jgi:hypothetical protein
LWALSKNEIIEKWREFQIDTVKNLPTDPFPVTTDSRKRYELTDQFIKRDCFVEMENAILDESQSRAFGKVPAVSVLGAKGAGKSTFFRYFVYKHCTTSLVVYVPNAGEDVDRLYSLLMEGLIFGLQCLDTEEAKKLLVNVRERPLTGNFALFDTLWAQWLKEYTDLCKNAYIVIDQLKREGAVFERLRSIPLDSAGYILISSTGILHHHNLSSVYRQLVYFYPVWRNELASIDNENVLGKLDQITTMMGAFSLMEGQPVSDQFITAARKHYEEVREKGILKMLLAVVQSKESKEPIDGGIWEDALDPNYLFVDQNKMVQCTSPEYTEELRNLLSKDKVKYKQILMDLLSDPEIVEEVGNTALGVHVEALLDIMWQEFREISWSQQRKLLGTTAGRASRTKGLKQISAEKGESFKEIQPIRFDGAFPTEEDLQAVDCGKAVYFKPTKTNYAGFDMFVLRKKLNRWIMYAIQVTVSKAADRGVDAFNDAYVGGWNDLLSRSLHEENLDLDWEFYMLTPQDDPSPTRPSSVSTDIPIYQVDFRDLKTTGVRNCGIRVVRDFVELLEKKRDRKKQKI